MKKKYNWDKLKLEYFASKIMDVKWFFEYKESTYSGHTKEKTKWWSIDKQKFIQSCKNQAEDELKEELVELYKPSNEEISQIYKSIFYTMRAKAVNFSQNIKKDNSGNITFTEDISISELMTLWKILRTEQWLPIQYKDSKENISIKEENENIIFYLPDNWRDSLLINSINC